MERVKSARHAMAAAAIAGALTLTLAGCDNALMAYLLKGILYRGWQVASWSTPAPVVAGETHLLGKSNGLPMNMIMGGNGMLHLVGWKQDAYEWVYTSMAPGAPQFTQAFTLVKSTPQGADDLFGPSPGMDLFADDSPLIS